MNQKEARQQHDDIQRELVRIRQQNTPIPSEPLSSVLRKIMVRIELLENSVDQTNAIVINSLIDQLPTDETATVPTQAIPPRNNDAV